MNAYTFKPIYKSLIWGGTRIAKLKRTDIETTNVGESWELSSVPGYESVVSDDCDDAGLTINQLIDKYGSALLGSCVYKDDSNVFPLLIKFIDAQQDLSIQVHPNDRIARARHNSHGKTEMWYVLDADEGAKIYCGLSAPLTQDGYIQCIHDNSIMDYVASYNSHPGQFFYVPAGTIHSIGAGNLVAEIQQTSDITYRVYDYNRVDGNGIPRQLHTELASDAIDYTYPRQINPTALIVNQTQDAVVKSEYFTVDFVKLEGNENYNVHHNGESFRIIMVTDGKLTLEYGQTTREYVRGTTVLVPASIQDFELKGLGNALLVAI